jgi:membrane protein implicated in regulation of membrane protease activity
MMNFTEWYEILFYGPFLIGVLFLFLLGTGMMPDHGADVDADLSHDFDASHQEIEGGAGPIYRALSVLGVGRAPVSVVLITFCFSWGFAGWASNRVLQSLGFSLDWFSWISVIAAMVFSVLFTGKMSRLLARIMPTTETSIISASSFVGKRATALYTITEMSGGASFVDDNGDQQEVLCLVDSMKGEIPAGRKVVLVRYDEGRHVFFVQPDRLTT